MGSWKNKSLEITKITYTNDYSTYTVTALGIEHKGLS